MPEFAPKPAYKILVNHREMTGDFTPYLTSLDFEDNVGSKSDSLKITLEDSPPTPQQDGPGLWLTTWYPIKGSQIQAWIGYEGNMLECGKFEIDDIKIDCDASGTKISLTCLASAPTKAVRTKKHESHKDKTLADIAAAVAAKHGFTLKGEIPDVHFNCAYQMNESDLAFLQRMADTYGAVFTVKGDTLIFHKTESLTDAKLVWTITKKDVASFSYSDKITTQAVKAAHLDGNKGEVIKTEVKDEDGDTEDAITIHAPVENKAQQQTRIQAATNNEKSKEKTATIKMEGNTKLLAGCNIELQGFGVLDGIMHIEKATHTLNSSGYGVSIECKGGWK
jgi:phage protein D